MCLLYVKLSDSWGSRRVIRHVALQRSDELRASFMAEITAYDPEMIIWIDESGCDRRNSMRKFNYTLKGIPPVDHRIFCYYCNDS